MLNNFSPNMLKVYQTCPQKFYLQYIEHLNMPKSDIPFEKGKKIHALANYYLQKIKIDKLENNLTPTEQKTWELLLNNEYFNKECLKSEFSLYSKIGKYWVSGRIDAVMKENDDFYILDYKTGTVPHNPKYDYQTMIYLLCLHKYLKQYSSLSFVYLDLKENKNIIIKFDKNSEQEYTKKIVDICNLISTDKTFKCNKENCKFCEYSKICNL